MLNSEDAVRKCQKHSAICLCIIPIVTNNHDCTLELTVSGEKIENISTVIFNRFHNYTLRICALISVFLIYKEVIMPTKRQGEGSCLL